MKRLLLSTCLLGFSATASASSVGKVPTTASKTDLILVKDTKYNVVGAVFAGNKCAGLNPKEVKAALEQVDVTIEARDTTLDQYVKSLRKSAPSSLRKLAEAEKGCQFQDVVVMGRFFDGKKGVEDITYVTLENVATPTTIVAYKKATLWNPEITTKSLVGFNSNPTRCNLSMYNDGQYKETTYVILSTKKKRVVGWDSGLKIQLSDKKTSSDLIATIAEQTMKFSGEVKFTSVPARIGKAGLTPVDYAAGIAVKAVGMTVPVVLGGIISAVTFDSDVKGLGAGIQTARDVYKTPNKASEIFRICSQESDASGSEETCRIVK